ncbi:leucine-rich repeat domain-containing protein [Lysinibacillus sp. CTST325]
MLTEEQIFLNVYEKKCYDRFYKYYKYSLDGKESFQNEDIELYAINGLSLYGQEDILDLSKLSTFSGVKAIALNRYHYTSVDTLSNFRKLEYFQILNLCDNLIPFNNFERLWCAEINYDKKTCNLIFDNLKLEYLTLHNYKEKHHNDLSKLKNVKRLHLNQFKLGNLEFISQLQNIEFLGVSYNRKLATIKDLDTTNLKGLSIVNCKKIADWETISELQEVEEIYLGDCGEIESVTFLNALPNLKKLMITGNTTIKDGLLKEIIGKPGIEIANITLKKHYDITDDDLIRFKFVQY